MPVVRATQCCSLHDNAKFQALAETLNPLSVFQAADDPQVD